MQPNTTKTRYYYPWNTNREKLFVFIGLNPSHAENTLSLTENKSDKTVQIIENFINEHYPAYGFIIINLSSQRTPLPKELKEDDDEKNLQAIREITSKYHFNKIVLFWGNGIQKHHFMENALEIKRIIEEHNKEAKWYCVKRNNSGLRHPKHFGRMGRIEELEQLDKNTINEYFNDLQAVCNK